MFLPLSLIIKVILKLTKLNVNLGCYAYNLYKCKTTLLPAQNDTSS